MNAPALAPPAAGGPDDAALGLALLAHLLGRDLQRAARAAGGAQALWRLDPADFAQAARLDAEGATLVSGWDRTCVLREARAALARAGHRFVPLGHATVPERLRTLFDPPFALFADGRWDEVSAAMGEDPVVAIVGSRRPSAAGAAFARELAAALAERGAVVVSGLAVGVDAAAHDGALAVGGLTVAVLGCGLGVGYPRANRELRRRIVTSGAVLSEYWPETPPAPWRFPARNRIVSGLAHATVVVEAGARSGALITADFALEAGRPVLAVPGAPWSATSEGCNTLIRAGAAVCCDAEDVIAETPGLPWRDGRHTQPGVAPEGLPAEVHARLQEAPRRLDELADDLGAEASALAAALALLELEGLVLRGEGQRYWATPRAAR